MEHGKTLVSVLTLAVVLLIFIAELFFRTRVLNVSAVEAVDEIGVYWDENCSLRVYSISWGVLSLGEVEEVVVYVRNEGNESSALVLTPTNWNPENACHHLFFSWSCEDNRIEAGEIVRITQSLRVSPHTKGITGFSFDIIFETRKYLIADINMDGVVDVYDAVTVFVAYGSTPEDSNWNPDVDLYRDGVIDIFDATLVLKDYGKTWKP